MTSPSVYILRHILLCLACCITGVVSGQEEPPDPLPLLGSAHFTKEDHHIDSVDYNCVWQGDYYTAYAIVNKRGVRNGPVLVTYKNGDFYARGFFAHNRKTDWWWFGGCCQVLYRRDREIRTVCAHY